MTFRSTVYDASIPLVRVQLLQFIARLYRALLVAQKCLASVEISPEDAEQIWHRRGNDCEIMRIRLKNGEGK